MAVVYAARHRVLPRQVAIKVMRSTGVGAASRARLLREACVLANLDHPAIVDVLDAGVLADGRAWLAMNIIDGVTLAKRLSDERTLPAAEVVRLLSHVASALAAAHGAGVVHRDLKPENILLVDGVCPVQVIDWGIAQDEATWDRRLTLEGAIAGTPHYMAPEQARGEVVDGHCDVYALGVVAYEMLSGAPPFTGTGVLEVVAHHLTTPPRPLLDVAPGVPAWLGELVMRMLAKDPAARPAMAEVTECLCELRDADDDDEPEIEQIIELTADMAEDAVDLELDGVIAELATPVVQPRRRLAMGSQPPIDGVSDGVIVGELIWR
jgi:serine/threonine-protein kinase